VAWENVGRHMSGDDMVVGSRFVCRVTREGDIGVFGGGGCRVKRMVDRFTIYRKGGKWSWRVLAGMLKHESPYLPFEQILLTSKSC